MYSSFDSRWKKVVSKDDIVSVDTNNGWKKGVAIVLNLEYVRIKLDETNSFIDVNCKSVKILKKKISDTQNIPIEVNDLVTLDLNNEVVSGIITSIRMSVEVIITSPKKLGKVVVVNPSALRFVAKGYSIKQFSPLHTANPRDIQRMTQIDTQSYSHLLNGMALLYPAPCIIMSVSHQANPEDYPESMAV